MASKIKAVGLQCEYRLNPIGIDVMKPRLSWKIEAEERNIIQAAYRIQVAAQNPDFTETVWDSGKVASEESVHVEYGGERPAARTRYYYRVQIWDQKGNESDWSEPAFWEMGLLGPEEWLAQWITPGSAADGMEDEACPLLRREFTARGKVKSARVYVTALGLYELHMNGKRVGDFLFTPGWTAYSRRLQYQTYDVTDLVSGGRNAIGVILGNGWYKGTFGFEGRKCIYGQRRSLLFQLHITYEDGSEDLIISDSEWKTSTGPILMSEIYNGETYDARLEKACWDMPGYRDDGWNKAISLEQTKEVLVAQENMPVKAVETIKPIRIIHTPKGEIVIDFGQNMVGWVRFTVRGAGGTVVSLQHAEVLDNDGNFYTENLRKAKQTIRYTLKGDGEEQFEPHFTFQGFRYVKLEGYPGEPGLADFTGVVIHSAMEQIGRFECSNTLVNQLQHNILWGQKGNFVDIPTDCPQRDERLGWTGDAQVFAGTACFNMNTALFFTKWLRDLKTEQKVNGAVPAVVPDIIGAGFGEDSACGWGDAAVIIPWIVYLCYGDRRLLEEQYESMKSYIEYIHGRAENGLLWNTGFHFGDWLALDAKEGSYFGATPNDLTATAFYAYSTSILAKTAVVLHKDEDAHTFGELHDKIVQAFREEFFTPSGRLAAPTQTAHVLTLIFNLVAKKDRQRTIDTLVKYLEQNKWHLATGFLGTPYLCHALSSDGRVDAAYKLLLQTDFPSWLYQVTKGATTIWEHWDGIKEDGSLWSADMNSFNHYAYGSIGDWLYRVAAGINLDETRPGYKHIIFKPQPCKELEWAAAELESMYGLIKIKWSFADGWMQVDLAIPHNTTASVILPCAKIEGLMENEIPYKQQPYDSEVTATDTGVAMELGSGSYSFRYPLDIKMITALPVTPQQAPWGS